MIIIGATTAECPEFVNLLAGPDGGIFLKRFIELLTAPLPGEKSVEFYQAKRSVRLQLNLLSKLYIETLHRVNEASLAEFYAGNSNPVFLQRFKEQEGEFVDIAERGKQIVAEEDSDPQGALSRRIALLSRIEANWDALSQIRDSLPPFKEAKDANSEHLIFSLQTLTLSTRMVI